MGHPGPLSERCDRKHVLRASTSPCLLPVLLLAGRIIEQLPSVLEMGHARMHARGAVAVMCTLPALWSLVAAGGGGAATTGILRASDANTPPLSFPVAVVTTGVSCFTKHTCVP